MDEQERVMAWLTGGPLPPNKYWAYAEMDSTGVVTLSAHGDRKIKFHFEINLGPDDPRRLQVLELTGPLEPNQMYWFTDMFEANENYLE